MSPGYIAVSQQDEVGLEVTARYEMMWLVMQLPDLMSGLYTFFCNPRTKHYSFTSIERECHIQVDRRKRSMVLLQVNDTQGLYPEREVLQAFQEGLNLLGLNSTDLIVDGDLTIDGKPIREARIERVQEVSWITHQRHKAIIWLVERYPSYSETPVDT